MSFYIYLHAKPGTQDHRGIFYVGKGCGNRAFEFSSRNRHHLNTINKYGKEEIVVMRLDCASEKEAFRLERELIKDLRAAGVELVNYTDGGEGTSGYRWTEEQRQGIRGMNRGLVGEKHGMFGMGHLLAGPKHPRFGKPCPDHVREATRRANTGKTAWNKGKKLPGTPRPESVKRRISATRTGMKWANKDGAERCVQPQDLALLLGDGWAAGRLLKEQRASFKEQS